MIIRYKEPGKTLGQLTNDVQTEIKEKIRYIGRLDPMASGLVCFLIGDECNNANDYLHSDKTYCFNLILGISTDSGDSLGIIRDIHNIRDINNIKISDILHKFNNYSYNQIYPLYSSFVIRHNGIKKPLWYFAKNGIHIDNIPSHQVTIKQLESNGNPFIIDNCNYFIHQIQKIDDKRGINLRKNEIITQYKNINNLSLLAIPFIAKVSGGTYIRKLCEDIGIYFGVPAIADNIQRVAYNFS
jgi:tRNA pseudouridine(55) synthase